MIDFRTFGRPLEWVIRDIPCLMAKVTKYDKKWNSQSWRSEISSRKNWKYQQTAEFEFNICLENGIGRYTIIDWHSITPQVSLVYFTVKDNVLEVRFDKELVFSRPIVNGEWTKYTVTILFSTIGRLTVECNGVEVVNQLGRTLYEVTDESYLQVGVYQFDEWPASVDQRKMYFQI